MFLSKYRKTSHSKNKKIKRYPKHIKKKLALKANLWRKYRLKRNLNSKIKYRKIAQNCKSLLYMHQASVEKKILSSNGLGKFYRYINSKLNCKSGIAPLINSYGSYAFDNLSKANLLNEYFASVCVQDNGLIPALQHSE